jgi:hypothetical protein
MAKFIRPTSNGGGQGTLLRTFLQLVSNAHFATKLLAVQQFAKRRLFTIVAGWLAVIAMGACAVCAHSASANGHGQPAASPTALLSLRREEDEDVPASGPGTASYTRYSSDLQSERSITDQQRKCRDRAERDGCEISSDLEFADEAISGAKHDRAAFEALMAAARAGRIKNLYIENLSRLARDSVLTQQTLRELSLCAQSAHRLHRRRH